MSAKESREAVSLVLHLEMDSDVATSVHNLISPEIGLPPALAATRAREAIARVLDAAEIRSASLVRLVPHKTDLSRTPQSVALALDWSLDDSGLVVRSAESAQVHNCQIKIASEIEPTDEMVSAGAEAMGRYVDSDHEMMFVVFFKVGRIRLLVH